MQDKFIIQAAAELLAKKYYTVEQRGVVFDLLRQIEDVSCKATGKIPPDLSNPAFAKELELRVANGTAMCQGTSTCQEPATVLVLGATVPNTRLSRCVMPPCLLK
jgi:hypothetical protein